MMIDTHCHISKNDYDNPKQIIKNMGNNIMIVSTASPEDIEEVIYLCENYKNIYGTIGIHPEFADTYKDDDIKKNRKISNTSQSSRYRRNRTWLPLHQRKQRKSTPAIHKTNKPCQ